MGSGPRTLTRTHGAATTRVVQPGDPFLLEVGGCSHRYHAVCARMACVGRPSKEMQLLHDVIWDATDTGLENLKPGMPTADLARVILRRLARRGYSRSGWHVGYGIGLGYPPTWLDNLRIKETDTHTLQPGTTFFLFVGLLNSDESLFELAGDPILVTADGYDRLTTLSRELTVK
jgi:Xaa-Pro aminopeptidase